ncbi:MAG: hypothetical protein ACHQ03_10375 [Candidatus Bathyarchaeia archaeon]
MEIKTRRTLRTLGYSASRSYYESEDPVKRTGVRREVDFLATKLLKTLVLSNNFKVTFSLWLVGECKHSETHDYFAFKDEGDSLPLEVVDYPLRLDRIAVPPYQVTMGSLLRDYNFPFVMERMVEVDSRNALAEGISGKQRLYDDARTFEACESLTAACTDLRERFVNLWDRQRLQRMSNFRAEFTALARDMAGENPRTIVKKLVETHSEKLFKVFSPFAVTLLVPMMVLDDNRGLVETVLREDGSVSFDKEAEVVLYPFMSHKKPIDFLDAPLPVMVCKHLSLPRAIQIVEVGTLKLIESVGREIENDPRSLIEESIIIQIESDRRQNIF